MSNRLHRILAELEEEVDDAMRHLAKSDVIDVREHYAGVHLGLQIAIEVVHEELANWQARRAERAEKPSRVQLMEVPSAN